MSLFSSLLAFVAVFMLLACMLYVVFGQVTVRKLRKNPETKEELGLELASGWDIVNVAEAMALPRSWRKKLEAGPLSHMYANSDVLHKHTNTFDKILGAIFYWLMMSSTFACLLLIILNSLGVFPE